MSGFSFTGGQERSGWARTWMELSRPSGRLGVSRLRERLSGVATRLTFPPDGQLNASFHCGSDWRPSAVIIRAIRQSTKKHDILIMLPSYPFVVEVMSLRKMISVDRVR